MSQDAGDDPNPPEQHEAAGPNSKQQRAHAWAERLFPIAAAATTPADPPKSSPSGDFVRRAFDPWRARQRDLSLRLGVGPQWQWPD